MARPRALEARDAWHWRVMAAAARGGGKHGFCGQAVHDALHGCTSQASRWASGRSSCLAVPEDSQVLGKMERPAEGLGDKSCQRSEMLSPRWAKEM